ncbi:MAG TPA: hypothetical protein VL400_04070, partial [Polyangiaceae bacterium]|nr:hypothetical protein [Polyangiaceae bacterium]
MRSTRVRWVLVALPMGLAACGESEAPPEAPRVPAPATTIAEPAPLPTTVVAPAVLPPATTTLSEARRAFARDPRAGVLSFDALAGGGPALACEAAYAHHQMGDDPGADALLHATLALPEAQASDDASRETRARCLYDDGLVHEARGERPRAAAAFAASLALRPNEVVEAAARRVSGGASSIALGATIGANGRALERYVAARSRAIGDEPCDARATPLARARGEDAPALDVVMVLASCGDGAYLTEDAFVVDAASGHAWPIGRTYA